MNRLERIILSITRRPIKMIFIVLLIFVVTNIISGSLIIYSSTEMLKENISSQIRPSLVFDTNVDIKDNILFTDSSVIKEEFDNFQKDWKYDNSNLNKTLALFENLINMNQIVNGTYSIIDPKVNSIENIITNYMIGYSYDDHNLVDNVYRTHPLIGVRNNNYSLIHQNIISIVEGNNFSKEDFNEISYKIIVYSGSSYIDEKGNKIQIKIGDTITYVNRIIDEQEYQNGLFEKYYKLSDSEFRLYDSSYSNLVKEYNEWYKSIILYEKEYKFEVIGFYEDFDLANGDKNYHQEIELGYSNYDYGYYMIVPLNTLLEIQNDYNEAQENLSTLGKINKIKLNEIYIFNNYFQLNNNDEIEKTVNELKEIIELNDLKIEIKLNNDLYLKIAGPLDGMNKLSKFLLSVGIGTSIILLTCVSVIFLKERRSEIGILLSMGESKKNIIKQVLYEMIIICCIGVLLSTFTSKLISKELSNNLLNSDYKIELSEEEKLMIDEEYSTVKVMNEYEEILESNNILIVSSISLGICLLSTSISALYILKMNPKEILM